MNALPRYKIGEDWFIADTHLNEFRHVDLPFKVIPFHSLETHEGYSLLYYDTTTKTAFMGSRQEAIEAGAQVLSVVMPPVNLLDYPHMFRHPRAPAYSQELKPDRQRLQQARKIIKKANSKRRRRHK